MPVINIHDQNYEEVVHHHEMVLVDFWQPQCPPCQLLESIIVELDQELGDQVTFVKLNAVNNPQAPSTLGIMSTPALVLYQHGKPVEKMMGFQSKQDIKDMLQRFLPDE